MHTSDPVSEYNLAHRELRCSGILVQMLAQSEPRRILSRRVLTLGGVRGGDALIRAVWTPTQVGRLGVGKILVVDVARAGCSCWKTNQHFEMLAISLRCNAWSCGVSHFLFEEVVC